jgi:membrane protease YdiL (CAAX protease family)
VTQSEPQSNGFAMAVLVEGGIGLVAIVVAWLLRVPLSEQFPPTRPALWQAMGRGLLVTLPMLAMFLWLVHSSVDACRHLREQVEWLIREMFPSRSVAQFALVAVLAGVGEELLFRGVIQYLAIEWTTPIAGLVLASAVFGLAHALSKLYFLIAAFIGLCFGWLALHYHDLVAPMVAHSVYDFVALVYLSRLTAPAER